GGRRRLRSFRARRFGGWGRRLINGGRGGGAGCGGRSGSSPLNLSGLRRGQVARATGGGGGFGGCGGFGFLGGGQAFGSEAGVDFGGFDRMDLVIVAVGLRELLAVEQQRGEAIGGGDLEDLVHFDRVEGADLDADLAAHADG